MARETEFYRDNLEAILAFTGGKQMLIERYSKRKRYNTR